MLIIASCAKYPELPEDDRFLLAELRRREIPYLLADWRDPGVDWASARAVLIRATWDYAQNLAEFRGWLDRIEAQGVRLINPVAVIRKNLDKHYLQELARAGVPTLRTTWVEHESDLPSVAAGLDPAREYVIKPCISAGAFRTERLRGGSPRVAELLKEILSQSAAMVQEFAPEIESAGEWSFLVMGGRFSHAVVKRAKAGDFRVQWTHGGSHRGTKPDPALFAQAEAVMRRAEAVFPGALYARVDGIVREGKFLLMELELFEPYFFFEEASPSPQAGAQRFVEAVLRDI